MLMIKKEMERYMEVYWYVSREGGVDSGKSPNLAYFLRFYCSILYCTGFEGREGRNSTRQHVFVFLYFGDNVPMYCICISH